jgi:hypothetical protein
VFHGAAALLTVRMVNGGHHRGQCFAADEWTSDVFVGEADGWKCALSHITPAAVIQGCSHPPAKCAGLTMSQPSAEERRLR